MRYHEIKMQPIRPPTDDVYEVMGASFQFGRDVGQKMVPIDTLSGGVSSDPREKSRVQKLKQDIMSEDGYISRLIVDTEGNVIEGQHRLEALRELGFKQVPVHVIQDLSIGIDIDAVIHAMQQAQPIHQDQCHGVLSNLLNTIADENGSVEIAKNDYESPGFQKAWDAACDAIMKTRVVESRSGYRAYHGTGKKFDTFKTEFSGTGEGYDARGHGIYFAENKELAEFYSNLLGKSTPKNPQAVGTLYEITLTVPKSNFLDWDLPWQSQSKYVKSVIPISDPWLDPTLGKELKNKDGYWYWTGREEYKFPSKEQAKSLFMSPNMVSGGSMYERLAQSLGSNKAASEALKKRGIPGNKYSDEERRQNLVIWDISAIKIVKVTHPKRVQESYDDETKAPEAKLVKIRKYVAPKKSLAKEDQQLKDDFVIDSVNFRDAIYDYTTESPINEELIDAGGDPKKLSAKSRRQYKLLVANHGKLSEEHHVYSGSGDFGPNKDFETACFISASLSIEIAANTTNFRREEKDADHDNILHFILPKGFAGGFYIAPYSQDPEEFEFLIYPNQAFSFVETTVFEIDGITRRIHTFKPSTKKKVSEDKHYKQLGALSGHDSNTNATYSIASTGDTVEVTTTLQSKPSDDLQSIYVKAIINGEKVGWGTFIHEKDSSEGEFYNIDVKKSFQRKGIATIMYDHFERIGFRIEGSGNRTEDGYALWKYRYSRNLKESKMIDEIKILDKPKSYNPFFNLEKTIKRVIGGSSKVGSIGKFEVYKAVHKSVFVDSEWTYFILVDRSRQRLQGVGVVALKEKGARWTATPYIKEKYRGSKLGPALYKLILSLGYDLQSEGTQTLGGKAIWQQLMQDPSINVTMFDNIEGEVPIKDKESPWNGNPNLVLHLSLKESNETLEQWFGGSKIVDANGKPLRMYHGTIEDFSQFDLGDGRNGSALGSKVIYFTADPAFASDYGKETVKQARDSGRKFPKEFLPGARVVPVYLRVTNPLVYRAGMPVGEELVNIAKQNGNDGIIFSTGNDLVNKYREVVVFDSKQVKNALSDLVK
jgi:hypothetical protein